MNTNSLAIIHFGDLAKYPPAINAIQFFSQELIFGKIIVCSRTTYKQPLQRVVHKHTVNSAANNRLLRLFSYIMFYLKSFLTLCYYNPKKVLYYETLSYPPVHFYYLLQRFIGNKISIYAHYHEYATIAEYNTQMQLAKWSHQLEVKQYNNFSWISHTNQYRIDLFKKDYPAVSTKLLFLLPNYPPAKWGSNIKYKKNWQSNISTETPLKLVYVGSLDIETMYTIELANWVTEQNGRVVWDIYSGQYNTATANFFKALKSNYINLKGSVVYDNLPAVLPNYDIGVIMYKCHIKNVIYCEPNKFFEYYTCGLDVWYPTEMLGMRPNKQLVIHPKVIEVDYKNMSGDLVAIKGAPIESKREFTAEEALTPLLRELKEKEV